MAANPQSMSQAVPTVKLLINGKFVESKANAWRDVVNPDTQEVLARVPMCDADEVGEAVKAAMIRGGIPANAIVVIGRGESQPLVPTADGVREPQNRRVEIVI